MCVGQMVEHGEHQTLKQVTVEDELNLSTWIELTGAYEAKKKGLIVHNNKFC